MSAPTTRDAAWQLLTEWTLSDSLRKHALAVEAAVRGYARKFGEDEEAWGSVALLHDLDYERYPTSADHPFRACEELQRRGYPDWFTRAILSHADYLSDRYPRRTPMEKGLYACDEITGLVMATALLRPTGITDLTAASVRKKMKSKHFARGVNRDDVVRGAAEFGVDLDEHIQFVIDAMKTFAGELGLEKGTAAPGSSGEPGEPGA